MKAKAPILRQFQDRFPTEESCLEHLKLVLFGKRHECEKCGKDAKFYRIAARRSNGCEYCGHQIYPTAGTPFHKTRTSLRDWFNVMFLFCSIRNDVAAKEVERQVDATTNGIEGFWARIKQSISGTHIHVSQKHLAKYVGEFEFRHIRRNRPQTMLSELILFFAL